MLVDKNCAPLAGMLHQAYEQLNQAQADFLEMVKQKDFWYDQYAKVSLKSVELENRLRELEKKDESVQRPE